MANATTLLTRGSVSWSTDPLVNSVVALAIYQRSGWAPWGG